ncbi:hypothetical protein L345_15944 [Ophiophagus hannah]|uniref:Uncharacterized protein n=1 Tax=Ophiophagus hannah TaxID=8665 RepID=V8N9K0_OPHHA|nr:hypothetical protein L345_15944 [Ophiophagus hannah]
MKAAHGLLLLLLGLFTLLAELPPSMGQAEFRRSQHGVDQEDPTAIFVEAAAIAESILGILDEPRPKDDGEERRPSRSSSAIREQAVKASSSSEGGPERVGGGEFSLS